MSDPSAFVEALQLENAALRQHIARLEKQQSVRRWPVTPAAARKHVEEALRASTAKLETLVQVSPLAITLLDTAGNVQLWNPAAEQIFGWTASEVIGQPNPIVPTSKQSEYAAWSSQILHGKPIANREAVRQRKDGSLVTVSISSAPVYDAAGQVTGRKAIIADITEHKRTEESLRESELLYELLVEGSPLCICRKDPAGHFTFANRRFLDETHIALADLVGKTDFDLHPPELAEKYRRDERSVMDSGQVWELIEERTLLGGESIIVQSIKTPIYDGTGKINRTQTSFWDITQRKRAEEALRQSELLYESLVEVSPLCICRKDLAGRFTFANRRFLEESNMALADLVGKTDFDLHPPELAEKCRRDDRAVIDSGQVWELIEERSMMDVESVIVQSIKTPIYDGSGNINGVQISFWDITARQRAEKALRELNATLEQRVAEANLHLAELSRLKDEFITRISHELRTPLANVKLYLQLLEQGQAEKREAYFLRSTNRSIACTTSSKICWMSLI